MRRIILCLAVVLAVGAAQAVGGGPTATDFPNGSSAAPGAGDQTALYTPTTDANWTAWGATLYNTLQHALDSLAAEVHSLYDTKLAIADAITSPVPFANGGTGLTTAADDTVPVSSGTAWVATAIPSCSNATTSKLLYATSTNSFSCGTDQDTGAVADNSITGAKIAMGSDARGDILYYNGTDYVRLPKGANGYVLGIGANDPAWVAAGSGDMLLGTAQTVTAAKTFADGMLKLHQYSGGGNDATLFADATVTTTRDYVLPSAAGILIGSGDTGTVTKGMINLTTNADTNGQPVRYEQLLAPTAVVLTGGDSAVTTGNTTTWNSGSHLRVPTSASETTSAVGQIAFDTDFNGTNLGALQVNDGTGTRYVVATTDVGTNGKVPTWNTGGTVTWQTPPGAGSVTVIASGTVALHASSISTGACETTAATATATGAATTDVITWTPNADISAVTGYAPATTGAIIVYPYATSNTVNFRQCNPTASSITPGAVTLNWRIIR